ncbi:MAG TPA: endonuclease/exonuclease/phosphatase family protein [Candidatus Saccharibacteria bacterium]|nr:endonuclease/exonuclease/phosphatase family protein [Candidatus Saccharibacteria bacterium]HRK93998.1 endonuclease/exonuclease/phosphatase family protein [Candidatus Saccharibacteria bacterium]
MPKLKDQQDADAQYDPYTTARDIYRQEQETGKDAGINAGIDQLEAHANDSANATKNIDSLQQQETGLYRPTGGRRESKRKFNAKAFFKKNGASAGIIGLLLGALGGITMLISPGLAAVQLKEILTDDLNDQLAAMDIRTNHVFKAKLRDMGTGICGPGAVKVKCGFKGMSDRQVKKFQKAGFTVETDPEKPSTLFGKNRVISLSIKDSAGNTVTMDNPREMNRLLGDRMVRNAVRKAFNPKFAGFFDVKSSGVYTRFNTHTRDKLGAGTDADKDAAVDSAVEGDPINVDANTVAGEEGDVDGDDIPDAEDEVDDNQGAQDTKTRIESSDGPSTKALFASVAKNGMKGAIKGVMITGTLDSACSVKNAARAVEAGAKLYRQRQLIAFAMVYLTFADQVKAGTATADQAEYVGNTLTAIDTDKLVVNEKSVLQDLGVGRAEEVPNPDYGKNAFDSNGYKTAMYNEAPTLSARDMQVTVGGGALMGSLSGVNDFIKKTIGDKSCKVIQSWPVRLLGLGVGIIAGVFTLGTSTAVSIGASIAIGMAVPLLENYLAQMVAGTVVNSKTKGVDAGNAIFSGSGGLFGALAMSRGMKPASKSDLKGYLSLTDEVQSEYVAMETEEAKKTPFDVMNRYSFLGSLARTLLPIRTTSSVSLGNSFMNTLGTLSSTISSLTPNTFAKNSYNEERFSKCIDEGYEEVGIDADIFCNVRYVMSPYELGLDTDEVRAWMYDNHHVSENGEPQGEYADWLTECTERQIGWGETDEETKENGKDCMKTDKKSSFFRVYTMDDSIIEAMEYQPTENITPEGDIGTLTVGSYNVRTSTLNNADFGDPDNVYDREDQLRMEGIAENIEQKGMMIVGTQEVRGQERQGLMGALENYGATKLAGGKHEMSDVIFYDKRLFKEVDFGTYAIPKQGTKLRDAVWAKLQTESGASVYVFNMHASLNASEQERAAKNTLAEIERVVGSSGDPVIVMGDMNSNDVPPENKVKLTFEASGILKYTRDVTTNRKGYNCDTISSPGDGKQDCRREGSRGSHRDQMWVTKADDIVVNSWENMATPENLKLSDHNPIIVTMDVPGLSTSTDDTTGGISFKAATFNILHAPDKDWRSRLTKSVNALKSKQIDIAGLQEARPEQQTLFKTAAYGGGTYDMYPSSAGKSGANQNPDSVVIWNKSKFELVKGTQKSIKYAGGDRKVNIAKLKYIEGGASGPEFYILNTHDPVDKQATDEGGPQNRKDNNELYYRTIKNELTDAPIVFTGDFNSKFTVEASGNKPLGGKKENLAYCILTRENLLVHASDAQQGKKGCNSTKDVLGRNDVDHIFISPSMTAGDYGVVNRGTNGGDHEMVFAEIGIPDEGGELAWPVDKKYWLADRADFLGPHTADSDTFTGVGRSLAADIGSPPDGSSVYAMLGGRVTGASLGGHGLIISTAIQGGVLEVAYAHGPRTGLENEYKAGDTIMRIGCLGNCEGGHLHVDMAFNGKGVCPQDVFLALDKGQMPDFNALTKKAVAPCGRS